MGDQILTKGRRLNHRQKVVKPQTRMIVPDIMLRTTDVLIPVVEPVPIKQSFNTHLIENKPQISRTEKYRNSPALLFSETPSHTLYNHLDNLFEVN